MVTVYGSVGKEMQADINLITGLTGQQDAGNDVIFGYQGKEIDTMSGGLGNTSYYVDNSDDVIISQGQGIDTVYSRVSYKIPDNVDNIALLGWNSLTVTGNNLDNILLGNRGNDTIIGGTGNNKFFAYDATTESYYGSNGSNTMYGGPKNNDYLVNDSNDAVVVNSNHIGTDTVYATTSYTMPEGVKRIYLVTLGDKDATGNSMDNDIQGNCGDNSLSGGDGNDSIYGGGFGTDTISGGAGNDKLSASLQACELYGGSGDDTLIGSEGSDTLCGGAGNDYYTGFDRNEVNHYYNIGFGDKVINKWLGSDVVDASGQYHDTLNLSQFDVNSVIFGSIDTNNNGNADALFINCSQYGTVKIYNYFDDTNTAALSNSGNANLTDILFKNNVDLHFADIQQFLT